MTSNLTPELRLILALNVQRRAAQIASADLDALAALYGPRLVELDYELESAGTALDRANGVED